MKVSTLLFQSQSTDWRLTPAKNELLIVSVMHVHIRARQNIPCHPHAHDRVEDRRQKKSKQAVKTK